ncbi:MAG: hypothetical protein ACFFA8_14485 [Promethearchaeota archaeon]
MQKKWKYLFLSAVVCSLFCGLIAVAAYVNYLVSFGVSLSDTEKLQKGMSIPLAFIFGFLAPYLAAIIQKIPKYL